MRIVSPLLKTIVYPALATAGVFRRTRASGLAIGTYHGVLPVGYGTIDGSFDGNLISADVLRRQLQLLKTYYNVISPEEFLDWREKGHTLPPKSVLLTCDDGLLNCLTDMLPVLQQESVKCLFFVTGASATDLRSMLWYEELFLLFLKGPVGPFAVSSEGITIRGTLDSREQRRAVWWDSVRAFIASECDAACLLHSFTARSFRGKRLSGSWRLEFTIVPALRIAYPLRGSPTNFRWNEHWRTHAIASDVVSTTPSTGI